MKKIKTLHFSQPCCVLTAAADVAKTVHIASDILGKYEARPSICPSVCLSVCLRVCQ